MDRTIDTSPNDLRHHWLPLLAASLAAVWLLVAAGPARADHTDLEEGLPVELADAYPVEYFGREVQTQLQYEYTDDEVHTARLEPRVEFGFPRNGQFALHVPLEGMVTDGDTAVDLGRPSLEFMYNLNQETLVLPGLALSAGVEGPGTDQGGVDPFAAAYLSKLIPGSSLWHGIHLNGRLQRNLASATGERDWGYLAAVGYAVRLTPLVVGVVDGVRERPIDGDSPRTLGEVGLRIQTTPLITLGVGAGAGVTDTRDLLARGTFSFQWFAF